MSPKPAVPSLFQLKVTGLRRLTRSRPDRKSPILFLKRRLEPQKLSLESRPKQITGNPPPGRSLTVTVPLNVVGPATVTVLLNVVGPATVAGPPTWTNPVPVTLNKFVPSGLATSKAGMPNGTAVTYNPRDVECTCAAQVK